VWLFKNIRSQIKHLKICFLSHSINFLPVSKKLTHSKTSSSSTTQFDVNDTSDLIENKKKQPARKKKPPPCKKRTEGVYCTLGKRFESSRSTHAGSATRWTQQQQRRLETQSAAGMCAGAGHRRARRGPSKSRGPGERSSVSRRPEPFASSQTPSRRTKAGPLSPIRCRLLCCAFCVKFCSVLVQVATRSSPLDPKVGAFPPSEPLVSRQICAGFCTLRSRLF